MINPNDLPRVVITSPDVADLQAMPDTAEPSASPGIAPIAHLAVDRLVLLPPIRHEISQEARESILHALWEIYVRP